ncbi:MAG: adenosylcobinamide-GDP ribazoletransferase [Micropruina sp.]|nr:adenosylcobinamide-GDP ribazoletransferase [Micropruina sp.]
MADDARPGALRAAFGLFTWIPSPPTQVDRALARRAVLALPWVGLFLGAAAGGVTALVLASGAGPLLAATLGVATVALASGAMHLDGLADTADGLGSRAPAAKALDIMRRSDIGPMGVASLVLVLAIEIAALSSPRVGWALPFVVAAMPLVGRVSAVEATGRWVGPARADGFGALFAAVTQPASYAVTLSGATTVVACLGAAGAVTVGSPIRGAIVFAGAALASWVLAWAWRRHLVRRLGGITGDCIGSLIEVAQVSFAVVVALAL